MTTYGTFPVDSMPAPSDCELTDCCQGPETEHEKVKLGHCMFYQEGSPPRRHVLLSRAGNPYIALDDDEALAFARQLEPVKALVNVVDNIIYVFDTNAGGRSKVWFVVELRAALAAVEGQDGNDKKPTRLG